MGEAPTLDLTGRSILVTGASSGIGRACAKAFAALGARVGLVGRNEERLKAVAASLAGTGHGWWSLDLCETEAIPGAVRAWREAMGPFDGLMHSAGVQHTRPARMETLKTMDRVFAVNVFAALRLVGALFSEKAAREEGGAVVLISSAVALAGQKGLAGYTASKGALVSVARSLAAELASRRWRVNCLAPGCIKGEMFDQYCRTVPKEALDVLCSGYLLGLGEPEDVAAAAAFLLSDCGRWITGVTLPVDGGFTCH